MDIDQFSHLHSPSDPTSQWIADFHSAPCLAHAIDAHRYRDWIDCGVIDAFKMILSFNNKHIKCKINLKHLFGKGVYEHIKHYKDDDATDEINEIKLNKKFINRVALLLDDKDDDNETITCNSLLIGANCPECSSGRINPMSPPRGKLLTFQCACQTCENVFKFEEIIIDVLANHYTEEIFPSERKRYPLEKCKSCKKPTYLNFKNICFFCGNEEGGDVLSFTELALKILNRLNLSDYL